MRGAHDPGKRLSRVEMISPNPQARYPRAQDEIESGLKLAAKDASALSQGSTSRNNQSTFSRKLF